MLRESYMYPFRGYWGHPAHCHIAVYEHNDTITAIATELDTNEGTSITNMAEYLATELWHELGTPDLDRFIWIERYQDRGLVGGIPQYTESFDRTTFTVMPPEWPHQVNQTQHTQVLRDPEWKRITKREVETLIGEPYVAPALDDQF